MSRIRKPVFALAVAVMGILCSASINAQPSAGDELDALLVDVSTLSAEVLQLIVESDGGVLEESDIQMYLQRPNGFYWETVAPFPELVVTDGETLWNYQPDLEQVVIEDWDSSRSELAAQLLSGETERLKREYQIEQLELADDHIGEFELEPLATDSIYAAITIRFLDGILETIHLAHKNGQQTVWQFSNVERNRELDENLFQFEIPNGIEIVDNSGV